MQAIKLMVCAVVLIWPTFFLFFLFKGDRNYMATKAYILYLGFATDVLNWKKEKKKAVQNENMPWDYNELV